ncbi:MAG TPA: tetratricopeptide repeat protein [Planctomycetota bacterium]|nr:tetratricopeptide repeat protein [Planctomycetota bacterium]
MHASTATPPAEPRSLREVLWLAAVLLATCAGLWPALSGGFVYDDRVLVLQNPQIRSWEGLRQALGSAYWDFLAPDTAARLGYWRPLTSLALFAGHLLGGGAAWGFHAVSLCLHLGAVAAAFALARRLLGSAPWAALCAALFALHPVQVEAVAWISAVNDPLYGLFVLLGLGAHLAWRERGARGLPLAAALAFALALLAKENAVAFLPLALALELALGAVRPGARRRAAATYLAVSALYVAARMVVFDDATAGVARVTTDLALSGARALTLRIELLGSFLGLLLWPADLSLFREIRPVIEPGDARFLGALALSLAWFAAALVAWRRGARVLALALAVPLAGVLPALVRMESLGRFVLSDRFLYVAVFGAGLALAFVARRLPRAVGATLGAAVVLAAGVAARARTHVWHDELSLFEATVEASPRSVYARWGLGRVLLERFQSTGDPLQVELALHHFETVQDLVSPRDGSSTAPDLFYTLDDVLQANVGVAWCYLDRALYDPDEYGFDEALVVFNATLERFPDAIEALTGRGVALTHMGLADAARGDRERAQRWYDEARGTLSRALELDERNVPAWFNLGLNEWRAGDLPAAARALERALELEPDNPQTRLWLGTVLAEGDLDPARARALLEGLAGRLPGLAALPLQLGALEARAGNLREALARFQEALAIDPRLARAHLLAAKVQRQLGQGERALVSAAEACRLTPDDLEAHLVAGNLLLEQGSPRAARPYLQRALAIEPDGPYAAELRTALDAISE